MVASAGLPGFVTDGSCRWPLVGSNARRFYLGGALSPDDRVPLTYRTPPPVPGSRIRGDPWEILGQGYGTSGRLRLSGVSWSTRNYDELVGMARNSWELLGNSDFLGGRQALTGIN